MKVLITGGAGFIGTNLRELYPNADVFDLVNGDDICGKLPDKDYDQIFHLAAKHHIRSCEENPEECISVNCYGTLNLVKKYPKARIIVASSSAANESRSVYGLSKKFTELLADHHPNYLAVRFYNVFGEHQRLEGGAFTPKLINHYLRNIPLTINGDGTQSRDFTYVGDLILNLKNIMESDEVGLRHLGYGKTIELNDYIKLVYGKMPTITYTPASNLDIMLSESPKPCLTYYGREEGMRRTIEWFKKEYNL